MKSNFSKVSIFLKLLKKYREFTFSC